MFTILTMLSGVAATAETVTQHASEVPELASMALLSVVLAGVSVAVRHSGPTAGAARDAKRESDKP